MKIELREEQWRQSGNIASPRDPFECCGGMAVLAVLLFLLAAIAEWEAVLLFRASDSSVFFLSKALVLHLISAALSGGGAALLWKREKESWQCFALLSFLSTLFLQAYGLACILLLNLVLRFGARPDTQLVAEFKEHIGYPEEEKTLLETIEEEGRPEEILKEYLNVEPFVDLLQFGDVTTRREVINTLATKRGPRVVHLLMGCLEDPSPEIYQYALAKIAKLQEEYTTRIFNRTQEVRESPSPAGHVRVAEIYFEYLKSGLADDAMKDHYWQLIVSELQKAYHLRFRDQILLLRLANYARGLGRFEEALSYYQTTIKDDPECGEAHLGIAESFYQMAMYYKRAGYFKQMFQATKQLCAVAKKFLDADQQNVLSFWKDGMRPDG